MQIGIGETFRDNSQALWSHSCRSAAGWPRVMHGTNIEQRRELLAWKEEQNEETLACTSGLAWSVGDTVSHVKTCKTMSAVAQMALHRTSCALSNNGNYLKSMPRVCVFLHPRMSHGQRWLEAMRTKDSMVFTTAHATLLQYSWIRTKF